MSLFPLYFINEAFPFIWYLKPLISSKHSLKKSLMFDLLGSNWAKGSFESTISTL